ncbi:N-acetyltransferase family protein [Streptomyces sp. CA-181903]|uniref:GNAT family N-acetyltransferase n=1 Tax=Streptomyces sp. CA-181903 TaxID=3240055 RepID=UPI003D8D1078
MSVVSGRRAVTAFLRFPYDVYRDNACWVPPLEWERRRFLSPRTNPFFRYGQVRLFLAHRGPRITGRIAAVRNPRYERFHRSRHGFFGLFECADDPESARALVGAVTEWLRTFGLDTVFGPVNFSLNDECGMLLSGFDSPPAVMMPYNPPYYPRLMSSCGFTKAKDLWAWRFEGDAVPPEFLDARSEETSVSENVVVRTVDLRVLHRELPVIADVYNAAWQENWGMVPLTAEELDFQAAQLKHVARSELILVAEVGGIPAGFLLAVPNVNEALAAAGGRLTVNGVPVGLVRLLRAARHIQGVRVIGFGVRPEYRRLGLDAALLLRFWRTASGMGYRWAECSWTLEDNARVNQLCSALGGERYKTYRIYQRPLTAGPPGPVREGRW